VFTYKVDQEEEEESGHDHGEDEEKGFREKHSDQVLLLSFLLMTHLPYSVIVRSQSVVVVVSVWLVTSPEKQVLISD